MNILSYFKKQVDFSPEFEKKVTKLITIEKVSKGSIIRDIDTLSKKIFFIESGLARIFYYKEDKDITFLFLTENTFSLPLDSIYYNSVCRYGIEALENTTICSFNYTDLDMILEVSPKLERIYRMEVIKYLKIFSEKLYLIQFQSAQERYNSLLQNYPDILLRAPLGHIASYMGITQETLSRIRAGK